MRYLSVDLGARRIGLAVCDEAETLASPYAMRERLNNIRDVEAIVETARGLNAVAIIVGLPLNPNGEVGASESAARKFAADLSTLLRERNLSWSVELWNESFSTRQAHAHMRTMGISQKRGRESNGADSTDAIAAAMILQNFLDSRNTHSDDLQSEHRVLELDAEVENKSASYSPKDLF